MEQKLEISAAGFRAAMKLPDNFKRPFEQAVKNGLRLMFGEGVREQTLAFMEQGEDNLPQTLADGVFSVVVYLYDQSNGTMPPQIIVPVGVELMGHAIDVAKAGGYDVPNEQVAEAMGAFIEGVLKAAGGSVEQMQQLAGGADSGQPTPEV